MWTFEHIEETTASLESMWERISKPEHWGEQSKSVEWAKIEGPFKLGAKITMQPKGLKGGSKPFEVTVVELTPMRSYTTRAKLPLGHFDLVHMLEPVENNKVRLRYRINITGPLSWMFVRIFGRQMAQDMPEGMQKIIEFALKSDQAT